MNVSLFDQSKRLNTNLQALKSRKVEPYILSRLIEKRSEVSIPVKKEFKDFSFNFFFNYNIFPENILVHYSEWNLENRKIKNGDTIVQQIYFPPTKIFSQKIIVGVRIKDVNIESDLISFSYETLEGHIEKGISTFKVEQNGNNLIFSIHTFSQANNPLLRLISPIFSSPYQDFCTKAALNNMINLFKKENLIS